MSFEADIERQGQHAKYLDLKAKRQRIEREATEFMVSATALHTEMTDPTDRAEIVAIRDGMIAQLRVIFGI